MGAAVTAEESRTALNSNRQNQQLKMFIVGEERLTCSRHPEKITLCKLRAGEYRALKKKTNKQTNKKIQSLLEEFKSEECSLTEGWSVRREIGPQLLYNHVLIWPQTC